MTNEEAKRLIEKWMNIIASEGLYFTEEYEQAFTKAISALSQPQGDLISRSEAIDITKWFFYPEMIAEQLKQLPSAQSDIEAIRQEIETKMNFCRAKDTVSYGLRGTVLKEVLDIIDKHIGTMREATPEERQSIDDYIDSISTKKQDSKIGYITIDDYGIMNTCSACGYSIHSKIKNFCPNCGCRMVEPQESEDKE